MHMHDDRHSLPVNLLRQMKTSQSRVSDMSGINRAYLSNVLSGKLKWPPSFDQALTDALGSADKAEVIRGAALEERRKFLLSELELVTTEQGAS